MKRKLITLLLALLSPALAAAHSVGLTWAASSTPGVSYHVQRAPCSAAIAASLCPTASEGTFAVIATVTTLTFSDSTVVGNSNYSYAISAFCPTASSCPANFAVNQDSALSNHVGAAIPPDPVGSPGNLAITSVTKNTTGANVTLTAQWTDAPGTITTYTVLQGSTVLGSNSAFSSSGNYSAVWGGKVKPGSKITFKVCDPSGTCDSRTL